MNIDLLRALCEADAIASSEQEVRDILLQHASLCGKKVSFDGLGSTLIQLNQSSGPKIMICAHMDEVGFMVRSITREGAVEVIPIGNVRMLARFMQPVRITTQHGKKIHGLLDAELHGSEARNLCVDIGATSAEEVNQCGVRIGDRVTYASDFKVLSPESRIMGKAFDDRLGCFLLIELMYALRNVELDAEIWLVASSSEEVGMRGGKTAAHMIQPDLALILDTACWSKNFDYGAANHRQIGQGPMLVMYDKTLIPSPRLLNFIQDTAQQNALPLQTDMFSNGGTDGGSVHLCGNGIPTAVLGAPTRHGHCAASIADLRDIEHTKQLLVAVIQQLNAETLHHLTDFSQ
ncbi:aminopeptidase [Hafnia alvei]|uniref:aminopeptidase n=1 Tax=Hafnia alvei TaxID=569 RepID=UPI00103F8652|nr:aminopeptidase [Hafnia alvei]QBJ34103.1 aminopeptidase [Hafnia alvei]